MKPKNKYPELVLAAQSELIRVSPEDGAAAGLKRKRRAESEELQDMDAQLPWDGPFGMFSFL